MAGYYVDARSSSNYRHWKKLYIQNKKLLLVTKILPLILLWSNWISGKEVDWMASGENFAIGITYFVTLGRALFLNDLHDGGWNVVCNTGFNDEFRESVTKCPKMLFCWPRHLLCSPWMECFEIKSHLLITYLLSFLKFFVWIVIFF